MDCGFQVHNCVRLPKLEFHFSCFGIFFRTFFSFFFFFSRYLLLKTINSMYSKFDRPRISRRTSVQLKLGLPGLGDPPQLGPPKFGTFKPLELHGSIFLNG